MLPAWTISTAPNAALVNEMLDKAIATLSKEEYPLIHSDYAEVHDKPFTLKCLFDFFGIVFCTIEVP